MGASNEEGAYICLIGQLVQLLLVLGISLCLCCSKKKKKIQASESNYESQVGPPPKKSNVYDTLGNGPSFGEMVESETVPRKPKKDTALTQKERKSKRKESAATGTASNQETTAPETKTKGRDNQKNRKPKKSKRGKDRPSDAKKMSQSLEQRTKQTKEGTKHTKDPTNPIKERNKPTKERNKPTKERTRPTKERTKPTKERTKPSKETPKPNLVDKKRPEKVPEKVTKKTPKRKKTDQRRSKEEHPEKGSESSLSSHSDFSGKELFQKVIDRMKPATRKKRSSNQTRKQSTELGTTRPSRKPSNKKVKTSTKKRAKISTVKTGGRKHLNTPPRRRKHDETETLITQVSLLEMDNPKEETPTEEEEDPAPVFRGAEFPESERVESLLDDDWYGPKLSDLDGKPPVVDYDQRHVQLY